MLIAATKTKILFLFCWNQRAGNNLVLQEDLLPVITVLHILTATESIISKCSLLLVPNRFSEPEAVHHSNIWDTWEVYLSFGKWEETWIKGRLTSKKAYMKTDLKTDNLKLLIRLLLLGEKTLWPGICLFQF